MNLGSNPELAIRSPSMMELIPTSVYRSQLQVGSGNQNKKRNVGNVIGFLSGCSLVDRNHTDHV